MTSPCPVPTASNPSSIEEVLLDHTRRYPLLQVRDLYKLLHQAAMGSEHAVRDLGQARSWLEREVEALGPEPVGLDRQQPSQVTEPTLDPISPEACLARVHLRPYLAAGGDLEALLQAFVQTANTHPPSVDRLQGYRQEAVRLASVAAIPFSPQAVEAFFSEMAAAGYPAAHHSAAYEAAYRPAYRVVQRNLLPQPWNTTPPARPAGETRKTRREGPMSKIESHESFMLECLRIAEWAMVEHGEFPIAAIAVLDGQVIASGTTHEKREGRYLLHAELEALDMADRIKPFPGRRRNAQLFTNLEPCLMCMGAAMSFGAGHVIYALESPGDGAAELVQNWVRVEEDIPGYQVPAITGGVLREESIALFERYVAQEPPGPMREWAESLVLLR